MRVGRAVSAKDRERMRCGLRNVSSGALRDPGVSWVPPKSSPS